MSFFSSNSFHVSHLVQKSLSEESKKKTLFPNCHWVSKKDEKRTHKRNNTPCKRWGHSVILFENQMFLFGGSGNNNNARNWETIYILNCDTYEWEKVCPNDALGTNTPEPRDSHACVRIGNNMYIFGGSNGENPLNDMFAFNLVSKTWIKIETTGEIPSPREGHSGVALHDRYFFIFGGWDGKNIFQNCYLFDYITKKWKMIEYVPGTEPLPRESHSCALLQDNIYIFGGQGCSIKKKDTYYNDLFKFKINIDKSLERVTGVWERLSSKNGMYPSPRTSHSIAAYKDSYLIVIGGEGYSSNNEIVNAEEILREEKEKNGKSENEEPNNDDSDGDDDHPPCYPKSDIWIYNIDEMCWHLLDVKNSELFLPRFTHSCGVYKDSLVIFGGLKDFKNSIDDLMVLVLDDNEVKKPIHLCSCCKKMLDTERIDEEIQVDPGKIGFELKKVQINIEEQENEVLEYATNSKPFLSLSYLSDLINLIPWPFAAFGLLIENALSIEASEMQIRWEMKQKYGYNPNRIVINDKMHVENFIVLEFNGDPLKEGSHYYGMMVEKTDNFYKNLKYAGLRLGETIFYVKRHENTIELYYVSNNSKNNPDLNDFISFNCVWDIATGKELSVCFAQMKKCILDNVSHIFTEEEILRLPAQNTIFILNLRKVLSKTRRILELTFKNDDICLNVPKILENVKPRENLAPIQYSLKSYLEYYFLEPNVNDAFQIYLNKKKINSHRVLTFSKDFKIVESKEDFSPICKIMKIFYGQLPKCEIPVSKDETKPCLTEPSPENSGNENSGVKNNDKPLTPEKHQIECPGILLYQNNKLVQQISEFTISSLTKGKLSGFVLFGYGELIPSIPLDFSKSVKCCLLNDLIYII